MLHQGDDLVLGLGAGGRLRDSGAIEIGDELADAVEQPRTCRIAVGLAEGPVIGDGIRRLLRGHAEVHLERLEHRRTDPVDELGPGRCGIAEVLEGRGQSTKDAVGGVDDGAVDVPQHAGPGRSHDSTLGEPRHRDRG
jgi:hypothetical protein